MESGIFKMAQPEETRFVACDGKRPEKEGELKDLHFSRRSYLVQDPPLGKGKEIPRSFFIIQSPEMFYFRLKSFNFIK